MGSRTQNLSFLILLLLGFLAVSFACDCSPPKPSPHPHKPPKHPSKPPKPPAVKPPKPPTVKPHPHPKPPTKPPTVKPHPHPHPKPPTKPHPTPKPPTKPPTVKPPPSTPKPPTKPPTVKPPPSTPKPPTHKPPPVPETCPIDTLKLGACVDVLGGLIHIGLGKGYAKEKCCPVLGGLVDLDAAVCLCTTIKAKLLNINLIIPIALEVLVACGKTPPPGFKCPA
ncbi:36.4 kDa proline-rich protein-like [Raphanus sativus]|nr:36.4 kDa proline-rich protein-like [Raphanus sativus]